MYRSENRDDHVEYFVTSTDGDALGPFVVSHLQDPAIGADTAWVHLGDFNFDSGTAGHVDLIWSAAGRAHSESADATAYKRIPH